MITCKMTCVIQGMLLSHYLRNVNLSNYGLSHVSKSLTPCVLSPLVFKNDKKIKSIKEHQGMIRKEEHQK
jgi:hypothetical protein